MREHMTTDNSRHQSITGNVTNANVNFGDNSTLTNTLTQLPAENAELKELLSQLQALINASPLSDAAKQKALGKTQAIAEATEKPKAEQQSIVQKTVDYFDGLANSLEAVPATALKLADIVGKMSVLFGL
jgi:flagellar biosynthesis/type III secretory pathway protein FliH